ncbi:MAG: glycosyltransferase family 4 protein [Anaerolineales bacterium]
MRILVLTRYERLGSSSRVRFYQYIPFLQKSGLDITVAPLLKDDYVRSLYTSKKPNPISVLSAYIERIGWILKSQKFDLIWLEKELLPWFPAWCERLLDGFGIPYIVDYDDAVFHRYDQHSNGLVRFFLSKKIDQVMRHAALVVVGNDYLKERAVKAGAKRVVYLPSVVDGQQYLQPAISKPQFNIGWIGSPVTAPYLGTISPSLDILARQRDVKIILIGSGGTDPLPQLSKIVLPWSEETEAVDIHQFDVGIMPLQDGPFENGKCGYKLIQYMAAGIPVVASPVGINRQIVEHGVNGFLASSEREWTQALEYLHNNPKERRQMGDAGRKKFEREYDLKVTAPQLLQFLEATALHREIA